MRPSPSNLRRPLPSSYELHRQVQRERSLATNALLRSATGQLVYSMGIVARRGVTLARQLINEWRRRREIRALLQFDDRALADMGLGRSEIEFVVRTGGHLANEVSLRERPVVGRISREERASERSRQPNVHHAAFTADAASAPKPQLRG